MMMKINNTTYSSDFTIEEIAKHSGKSLAEIEAIILSNKKIEVEVAINKTAAAYQEKIVPNELKEEYKRKEVAARNYLKLRANKQDVAILKAEIKSYALNTSASSKKLDYSDTLTSEQESELKLREHAKVIVAKAEKIDSLWANVVAFRSKYKAAIRLAKSEQEIENLIQEMQSALTENL